MNFGLLLSTTDAAPPASRTSCVQGQPLTQQISSFSSFLPGQPAPYVSMPPQTLPVLKNEQMQQPSPSYFSVPPQTLPVLQMQQPTSIMQSIFSQSQSQPQPHPQPQPQFALKDASAMLTAQLSQMTLAQPVKSLDAKEYVKEEVEESPTIPYDNGNTENTLR